MGKISPKKYRSILDGLELKNILISELKASVKHELLSEGLTISIKDFAEYENRDGEVLVKTTYRLMARNAEKKIALKMEATFIVIFSSKNEISDEFFDVYKNISLPLNIWPFFREFVNATTARMNIPPITLPLLKR